MPARPRFVDRFAPSVTPARTRVVPPGNRLTDIVYFRAETAERSPSGRRPEHERICRSSPPDDDVQTRTLLVVALLVVTAGCSTATGYEQRYVAAPAAVADDALAATGYERVATETTNRTRTVYDRAGSWEGGGTRNVTVVNRAVLYRGGNGTLVVFSSPARRSTDEGTARTDTPAALVERARAPFGDRLASVDGLAAERTRQVSTLETTANVTVLSGTVDDDPAEVHVFRVKHDDDIVVAVAVVSSDEPVDELFENVTHG